MCIACEGSMFCIIEILHSAIYLAYSGHL